MCVLSLLEELTDFHIFYGKEYELHNIFYFYALAILLNAKSYTEIATFTRVNFSFLKEHFGLKRCYATDSSAIRKIILAVDTSELEAIFHKDTQRLEAHSEVSFKQICFDGKTLYGSLSHTKGKHALGVFSSFAAHSYLVLAYLPLEATKNHAISALQEFLLNLNLKDRVITSDALYCQKPLNAQS